MRTWLVLLALVLLLLGALWIVGSSEGSRGVRATPPRAAPAAVPPASVVEDAREPLEKHQAAVPEPAPTPSADPLADFPRSALAGRVEWNDGTPAAGIPLEVRSVHQREAGARALGSLVSGEDGAFALVVPGTGPFLVHAFVERGGGTCLEATLAPVEADSRELSLRLPGVGRLRGQVQDERGEPVKEFTLTLRRSGYEPSGAPPVRISSRSEDGRFETGELAAGRWDLTASAPGFCPAEADSIRVPSKAAVEVRLERAARVSGFVRDGSGVPVPGARVVTNDPDLSTTSDEEGAFALDCPRGSVSLSVDDLRGESTAQQTLELRPGEERTGVVLRLGPAGELVGEVVGLGGIPAAGREVWLIPQPREVERAQLHCVTDERGDFHSALAPGSWQVWVELAPAEVAALRQAGGGEGRAEHTYACESVSVGRNERAEVWLALGPTPVQVRGTLTKAGEPCEDGSLSAHDVLGVATYEARVVGSSYALDLARPGLYGFELTFARTTRSWRERVPALGTTQRDFDLPVGWIDGFLRTPSGERVRDAPIQARTNGRTHEDGGRADALTDDDGNFSLELAPGSYTISTGKTADVGFARSVASGIDVRAGQRLTGLELVTFADEAELSLEVLLTSARGAPLEDARVRLLRGSAFDSRVRTPLLAEAPGGCARFYRLSSGDYWITAEAPGFLQLEECSVRTTWGRMERVTLALAPARELAVEVRAPSEWGLVSALDAVDGEGRVYPARRAPVSAALPDPEHEPFGFPGLPEGELLLRVSFPGRTLERPVHLGVRGAPRLTLELP